MYLSRLLPVTGLVLLATGATSLAAEPSADWRQLTRQLLETTWDKKTESRQRADELFAQATLAAPGNSLPLAAYWLVLLEQARTQDAAKQLDEYLKADPNNLTALRARVRLSLAAREYPLALVLAERVAKSAASQSAGAASEPTAEQAEAARFLGRMVGFLEKPLAKTYDQRERADLQARLVAQFDERRKELLEEGRQEVLTSYAQFSESAEVADKTAQESAVAKTEKKLADIEKREAGLDEEVKQLAAKQQELKTAVQQKLADLDRQNRDMAGELQRLNTQATKAVNESKLAQSQGRRLQDEAQRQQDPRQRQQLQARAEQAMVIANQAQSQLERISATADQLQRALNAGTAQRKQVQAEGVAEARKLEGALQKLEKTKQRTEKDQLRAERGGEASSSAAESLRDRSRAFTTYDRFPLVEMRRRLLAHLNQGPGTAK